MRDAQPPCTRCKKRGLPCTVNRSLQMLLDGDNVYVPCGPMLENFH